MSHHLPDRLYKAHIDLKSAITIADPEGTEGWLQVVRAAKSLIKNASNDPENKKKDLSYAYLRLSQAYEQLENWPELEKCSRKRLKFTQRYQLADEEAIARACLINALVRQAKWEVVETESLAYVDFARTHRQADNEQCARAQYMRSLREQRKWEDLEKHAWDQIECLERHPHDSRKSNAFIDLSIALMEQQKWLDLKAVSEERLVFAQQSDRPEDESYALSSLSCVFRHQEQWDELLASGRKRLAFAKRQTLPDVEAYALTDIIKAKMGLGIKDREFYNARDRFEKISAQHRNDAPCPKVFSHDIVYPLATVMARYGE